MRRTNKWWIGSLIILLLSTSVPSWGQLGYAEEAVEVIEIGNAANLQKIGNDPDYPLDGDYIQTATIDLADIAWNPIGPSFDDKFSGTFNGQGYAITNLTLDQPLWHNVGLFGILAMEAFVHNVTITGADIEGHTNVGAIAGLNLGSIISSDVADSAIAGVFAVGGVTGSNEGEVQVATTIRSTISAVESEDIYEYDVAGVGGITGMNMDTGVLRGNYVRESTISSSSSMVASGGLAGMSFGHVFESFVAGDANHQITGSDFAVGGLIGYNGGNIEDSYVIGDYDPEEGNASTPMLEGMEMVGGLTGYNYGNILNSYVSNVDMSGLITGGLAGINYENEGVIGSIKNSYVQDSKVIGVTASGGLVGGNGGDIQDAEVKNTEVTGDDNVGGLVAANSAGELGMGIIARSSVIGSTISSATETSEVGGLVGLNENEILFAEVKSSEAGVDTEVSGVNNVGGLVGVQSSEGSVLYSEVNATITATGEYVGGLIGRNEGDATANSVKDSSIEGEREVGGLVGTNLGSLWSSYLKASKVSGSLVSVGGLVGENQAGAEVKVSYVDENSEITGDSSVGGLVGTNEGSMEMTYADSIVVTGEFSVGGLAGFNDGSIMNSSVQLSSIIGPADVSTQNIGGLVGYNYVDGNIKDTFAKSNVVEGSLHIGGLVGRSDGDIASSYAAHKEHELMGDDFVGPLVGYYDAGQIINSYYDSSLFGTDESFVGDGLTTGEMSNLDTYPKGAGEWNFDETWVISHVSLYPLLKWQLSTDFRLDSLDIDPGELSPEFAGYEFDYTAEVPYTTDAITVTATVYDADSLLNINGTDKWLDNNEEVALEVGANEIPVTVTAASLDSMTYTIIVNRAAPSSDSSLKKLEVNAGSLEPAFDQEQLAYELDVSYSRSSITVSAEVYDTRSELSINGEALEQAGSLEIPLEVGENEVSVVVTAEDATQTTYMINIDREEAPASPPPAPPAQGSGEEEASDGETRQTDVLSGDDYQNSAQVEITRTSNDDGQVLDLIQLDEQQLDEILQTANGNVKIVFTDVPEEPADQIKVELPGILLKQMSGENITLQIEVKGTSILLLQDTIEQLAADGEGIYFLLEPIREQAEQETVQSRIGASAELQTFAQGRPYQLIGQPIKIETNYADRSTLVTLPLDENDLPVDPQERFFFQNELAVFIEHSDGETAIQPGQVIMNEEGKVQGIEIEIDKFSTFSIIQVPQARETVVYEKYISGYPDGTFRPSQAITRAELAVILGQYAEQASALPAEPPYDDVKPDHWAMDDILTLWQAGIMRGDEHGQFHPAESLTRAEMATVAWQWHREGEGAVEQITAFTDTEGHWASHAIQYVAEQGIMIGYEDGSFQPNDELTRAEAIVVINLLLDRPPLPDVVRSSWSDVPLSHWAMEEIESASTTFELEQLQ